MPITPEQLKDANAAMKGNTNRAILFTTVNMATGAQKLRDYLPDMMAGLYSQEKFTEKIREQFACKSFQEFLDKFKPCYFYRLRPPREPDEVPDVKTGSAAKPEDASNGETGEKPEARPNDDADVEDGAEDVPEVTTEEDPTPEDASQPEEPRVADTLPEFEFSLEGGPAELGWKRVNFDMDHPLFKSLSKNLRDRALTSRTTAKVDVDAALFGYKPESQYNLMRKTAKEYEAIGKKLALEIKRNPDSPETRQALDAHDRKLLALENTIGDDLRVLPSIAYGLAQARKALGTGADKNSGPQMNNFVLELGENAKLLVKPELPEETLKQLPEELQMRLEAGQADYKEVQKALEASTGVGVSGDKELVLLRRALNSHALAFRPRAEIMKMPEADQYPALVGSLMTDLVRRHKIQPAMGNMLAVILQDPKQLALWNCNKKEVEVFHDTFLGVYSMAVQAFITKIVPMCQTLMGIYAFFNEWPAKLPTGQPELIVTNDDLSDLWKFYDEEISFFFRLSCAQANNQYRDAIALAIVPYVEPLKDKAPAPPPSDYIHADNFAPEFHKGPTPEERIDKGKLYDEFHDIRSKGAAKSEGFGKVAGAPELLGLMQLGYECNFGVFFSPENNFTADRADSVGVRQLQEDYCPSSVVDRPWAVTGVMCVPDFVVLPPDGLLFTGTVMDGRMVGVDVPEIVVRSCYVAAGRILSNDDPEALNSLLRTLPTSLQANLKVRRSLPGIGVDLVKYPFLGKTNLAPDHYLNDPVVRMLSARDKSFLVFQHVTGQNPSIAVARTLGRIRTEHGEQYTRFTDYRQQVYLKRLFYAAYFQGYGGAWPTEDEMNGLMTSIITHMGWYDEQREGYVNAFPSELEGDTIGVLPVTEGNKIINFKLTLPLKAAELGPFDLSIE